MIRAGWRIEHAVKHHTHNLGRGHEGVAHTCRMGGGYNGNIKGRITPNPTTQLFTIDSSGTATIRKYNHEIRRAINNDVWLDDVLQDN